MSSLGKDLASIRQHQHLSLEDIYDSTRIPVHIIESIEDDTLFTEINENATYIRSFVRSYAKALKINDEAIIKALDQVENGEYDGSLTKEDARIQTETTSHETTDHLKTTSDTEEEDPSKGKKAPRPQEKKPLTYERDKITSGRTAAYNQADPNRQYNQSTPPPPNVNSINWADMGKKFYQFDAKSRFWLIGLIIVLIAGGAAFYFYYQSGGFMQNSGTPAADSLNTSSSVTVPDSLDLGAESDTSLAATNLSDTTNQADNRQKEQDEQAYTMPDTLELIIYAAHDKLEPVRVLSDINDRLSPYWIEKGDAMKFDFVERIQLRGQYGRLILMYNDHVINNFMEQFYNRDQRFVIIQREVFDDPKWYTAPPDSFPANVPPPSIIKERPQF